MKRNKINRLIYCFLFCCLLIYGVANITYATEAISQVDAILTIQQDGKFTSTGDLFGGGIWYPGYQKEGILRIINNYKGTKLDGLELDVRIIEQKSYLSHDLVYNSFLEKMNLTIEKGNLFNFNKRIVDRKALGELLKEGINFPQSMISLNNSMDFRYTLKMDEGATNELQGIKAIIGLSFNAGEVIKNETDPDDNDSAHGESGWGQEATIAAVKPNGGLIDRSPGYIDLNEMREMKAIIDRIILPFNSEVLKANAEHSPRIYYWNTAIEKWIALASYTIDPYHVMAINDGAYIGFFKVFGVIQPSFTDIVEHCAESVANRMNGLGILEGYPVNGLIRTAELDKNITRIEFATLIYRLVNINPDKLLLEQYTQQEAEEVLARCFEDAQDIPVWVRSVVASMAEKGLIQGKVGNFMADEAVTCSEAIELVTRALDLIKEHQSVDLLSRVQPEKLPYWARVFISEDLIGDSLDKKVLANCVITRAEALTALQHLFINGMGL